MGLTLAELAEISATELRGEPTRLIERVAALDTAQQGEISFLTDKRYRPSLADTQASAVIISPDDADDCPVDCLVTSNPYLAHARVSMALYPPPAPRSGIHPTAFVDADASVASTAEVGAQCFVGAGASIGAGVILGPGSVVMENAVVGDGSRLVASVTLCAGTELGRRCLIHPGSVIGSDGFGLANDDGVWTKVAQVGRVVLGDDVEVGACCAIDRGAIGDTVLADGVKLDNEIHVAHNVRIGRHTAIAGCVGIAGSTEIGDYCTLAGGVLINGHIELADHVHVSGATTVTRSIRKPGVYTGTIPATEHAAWLKNFSRLRHLDDMVRRIKTLEGEIAALKSDRDGAKS